MTFSIKMIIRACAAPRHRLSCHAELWAGVTRQLERRGEERHEAGVFLLGYATPKHRRVVDTVYYDELDPDAYSSGVCILYAPAFAKLWAICRERKLTVVADVHTHKGAANQSASDKANPMVARDGHVAIIVPNFAVTPVPMEKLGIYEYRGGHTWRDCSPRTVRGYFYSGIWS